MRSAVQPKLYQEATGSRITSRPASPQLHAQVLEHYINVCVDAVPVNFSRKTLWLAKRRIKPQQDWWWIGGQILAGEIPEEAMSRKFQKETSVAVTSVRFVFVCLNRYFWKDREQPPQNQGSDCLCYTFLVELTDNELKLASQGLDPNEYDIASGLREFNRDQLAAMNPHPAIMNLYDRVFS